MMQEDAEDETAFLFSVIFSEFSCKWVEGWGISHESPFHTGIRTGLIEPQEEKPPPSILSSASPVAYETRSGGGTDITGKDAMDIWDRMPWDLRAPAVVVSAQVLESDSFAFPSGITGWKRIKLSPYFRDRGTGAARHIPGVYVWVDEDGFESGKFLYVGQSEDIGRRLRQHFKYRDGIDESDSGFIFRKRIFFHYEPVIWYLRLQTLQQRLMCESEGIAFGHPVFNGNRGERIHG